MAAGQEVRTTLDAGLGVWGSARDGDSSVSPPVRAVRALPLGAVSMVSFCTQQVSSPGTCPQPLSPAPNPPLVLSG